MDQDIEQLFRTVIVVGAGIGICVLLLRILSLTKDLVETAPNEINRFLSSRESLSERFFNSISGNTLADRVTHQLTNIIQEKHSKIFS